MINLELFHIIKCRIKSDMQSHRKGWDKCAATLASRQSKETADLMNVKTIRFKVHVFVLRKTNS